MFKWYLDPRFLGSFPRHPPPFFPSSPRKMNIWRAGANKSGKALIVSRVWAPNLTTGSSSELGGKSRSISALKSCLPHQVQTWLLTVTILHSAAWEEKTEEWEKQILSQLPTPTTWVQERGERRRFINVHQSVNWTVLIGIRIQLLPLWKLLPFLEYSWNLLNSC